MNSDFTEGLILKVLKDSEISLTIDEIAKRAGIHRITASKYLAVLEAKGHLQKREVGKAKLYSTTDRTLDGKKIPGVFIKEAGNEK